MGIDYSLCLAMKREDADVLLGNLCELLDARSRARIGSRRWSPESEELRTTLIGTTELDSRGIAGVERDESERPNLYCFSLQIQLEQELESLVPNHNLPPWVILLTVAHARRSASSSPTPRSS
jgi:hypothetical protein